MKIYKVEFDDEEDMNSTGYYPGAQFEFDDWSENGHGIYTVIVDDWAVSAFEQALNTNSHVVTYREVGD